MNVQKLQSHLEGAITYLTDIACNHENNPIGRHGEKMLLATWRGAIRGEYYAANREWNCLCPIWHTGQAVKALVMASEALNRPELLEAAEFSAGFVFANRIIQGGDTGLILAFEDHPDKVNTSAILESLDGLLHLGRATGETKYQEAVLAALYWIRDHAWNPHDKLFYDLYDPYQKYFAFGIRASQNRPLLDDAMFLKGWLLTGDDTLKKIALDTADTLLETEDPPGNWAKYIPCLNNTIHPRHAYWWGMPMLDLYEVTGDERYRECFIRAVDWYRKAVRLDGGFIRGTAIDFNTDSFGHATSGSACAAIIFMRYRKFSGDDSVTELIERCLDYCCSMQFTNPADPNLKGAILEKVRPPNGTDQSPYHIRDLGTIFFIQAASLYLKNH